MILSHTHKFIFLKTNKTGGTSVEIALSRYCGPDDVVTPISAEDEALRSSLGHAGPQNYRLRVMNYRSRHWRLALHKRRRLKYYNHMPAREIRLLAGEAAWRGYFKFCFERNPWDRVLSLYFWRHPREPRPGLDDFIASDVILNLKDKGSDLYCEGGAIVVDRVCRHEHFAAELDRLAADLRLPGPLAPPRAKTRAQAAGSSEPVPAVSAASLARLQEVFAFELRRFGYRLPAPAGG